MRVEQKQEAASAALSLLRHGVVAIWRIHWSPKRKKPAANCDVIIIFLRRSFSMSEGRRPFKMKNVEAWPARGKQIFFRF